MDKEKQAVFDKIISILAGKIPPSEGHTIIAQDVVLYMDNAKMQGYDMWYSWITFIQTQGQVQNLFAELTHTTLHEDGTITAHGHWTGFVNGQFQTSNNANVRYRIENGMIREIWSHRCNYIFPLPLMKFDLLWWLVGIRYMLWKRFSAQRRAYNLYLMQ